MTVPLWSHNIRPESRQAQFLYEVSETFMSNVPHIELHKHTGIYEDKNGDLSITEIRQLAERGAFRRNFIHDWNYNFKSAYWLKLDIKVREGQEILLMFGTPILTWEYIDIYVIKEGVPLQHFLSGSKRSPEVKPILDFRNLLRLKFQEVASSELFIRYSGVSSLAPPAYMPVLQINEVHLKKKMQRLYIQDAIFFTLLGFISLFFIMFFFQTKEKSWLYISLFTLSYTILWLIGGAPDMIFYFSRWFPTHQELVHPGFVLAEMAVIWTLLKFTEHYLELRQFRPQWLKFHSRILIFFSIWLILTMNYFWWLPVNLSIVGRAAVGSIPRIVLFLPLIEGIILYRKGFKPAKFFLMAFSVPLLLHILVFAALFLLLFGESRMYELLNGVVTPIAAGISATFLALGLGYKRTALEREKKSAIIAHNEQLKILNSSFMRFVPFQFIHSIGKQSIVDVKVGDMVEQQVSVLFSDIRSYTGMSENMTPTENFHFVNSYVQKMGPIIERNYGFIDQYMGDGIMAIFQENTMHALQAAIEMQIEIQKLNLSEYPSLRVGIGIHTGPIIMGIIGDKTRAAPATISDTVNVASRVESLTKLYGANILATSSTILKIKDPEKFHLRFLGSVRVKGKQKQTGIYECFDGDSTAVIQQKEKTMDLFQKGLDHLRMKEISKAKRIFNQIVIQNPEDRVSKYFLEKISASAIII